MQSFEWVDAQSVEHAATLLSASRTDKPVIAKAGGIDVLDLMKEGILQPARVVNLKAIPQLDMIAFDAKSGLRVGTLATLARIAANEEVRRNYPALGDAALHAATPQVRNVASLGGNVLQRPRCWYFRNAQLHGAVPSTQRLREAQTQYHAIFDNSRSAMVHASTPATALIAYDASVHLSDQRGRTRSVKLQEFLLAPDAGRAHDAAIQPSEVLTHITMPAQTNTRSAYHKQTERDSYDWPICDVAVCLQLSGSTIQKAAIVMGWVAPTPRRAAESERFLIGKSLDESVAREAGRLALTGATAFPKNEYKLPVLETVVRRTLLAALG